MKLSNRIALTILVSALVFGAVAVFGAWVVLSREFIEFEREVLAGAMPQAKEALAERGDAWRELVAGLPDSPPEGPDPEPPVGPGFFAEHRLTQLLYLDRDSGRRTGWTFFDGTLYPMPENRADSLEEVARGAGRSWQAGAAADAGLYAGVASRGGVRIVVASPLRPSGKPPRPRASGQR
jgi:hypothetical protein